MTGGQTTTVTSCETLGIPDRYQRPGWFTRHVFNRAVAALTRAGVSIAGSRILEVRGRKTGEPPYAGQPADA